MKRVVHQYVDGVNQRDLAKIEPILADDCRFIDSKGDWIQGRDECLTACRKFFDLDADFKLQVDAVSVVGDEVLLQGKTSATIPGLAKDTLWRARSDGRKLAEWQSFGEGEVVHLARMLMGPAARTEPVP